MLSIAISRNTFKIQQSTVDRIFPLTNSFGFNGKASHICLKIYIGSMFTHPIFPPDFFFLKREETNDKILQKHNCLHFLLKCSTRILWKFCISIYVLFKPRQWKDTFGRVICSQRRPPEKLRFASHRAQGAREKLSKSRNTGDFLELKKGFSFTTSINQLYKCILWEWGKEGESALKMGMDICIK